MDLLIKLLLIVFFVWLVGIFFGWLQGFGGTRNPLILLLAILLALLLMREFGLFSRRGRLFCLDRGVQPINATSHERLSSLHTDERTEAKAPALRTWGGLVP